jgi:hypothetical protein
MYKSRKYKEIHVLLNRDTYFNAHPHTSLLNEEQNK